MLRAPQDAVDAASASRPSDHGGNSVAALVGATDGLPDLTALTRDPEVTTTTGVGSAGARTDSQHTRPPVHKRTSATPAGAAALRALHAEHFDAPPFSPLQVILTLCAYVLFVTDIPRAGSSLDALPFTEIEPNVFASDGPTVLPTLAFSRSYDSTDLTKATNTVVTRNGVALPNGVPTERFKYNASSYGMRSILAERYYDGSALAAAWPSCMATDYDSNCGQWVTPSAAFDMLETIAAAIKANAVNTTCYKTVGNATAVALSASATVAWNAGEVTRDYLSTLPQRVRFAVRTKARWIDGASNFLSHHLLDQKYWISTWATYFGDFNASSPGVDLCVDDLDRPLFCEKTWADFARLAPVGSPGYQVGKLWDDISDRTAALQAEFPTDTLDLTLIETETDPLTFLGGAVLLAHKVYNVVALFRVRDCVTTAVCRTLELRDVTYEGRVLYTDALEWRVITKAMRYFAQVYNVVRLAALLLGCGLAVRSTTGADLLPWKIKLKRALQLFFAVPSQVVVYGSLLPVFLYSSAHVIDGVMLYEVNDAKMHTVNEYLDNRFVDMVQLLSVRMRNVWVLAVLVRVFVFIQTSGGWTPAKGISSLRGYLLPLVSLFAVAFVLRNSSLQDARILETNEVEPAMTFMFIRAETLDSWKMNLFGVYNDFLSLFLTCVAYVVVSVVLQLLHRSNCWPRVDTAAPTTSRSSLFFTNSSVPYAAGFLWEPSCLVVCWDNDLLEPLRRVLPAAMVGKSSGSGNRTLESDLKRGANAGATVNGMSASTAASSEALRYSSRPSLAAREDDIKNVLMNIAFLTDPWNFLAMKFSRTRVYLYKIVATKHRLVHPYSKSRFVREYEIRADDIDLQGTFTASELTWDQVIMCK